MPGYAGEEEGDEAVDSEGEWYWNGEQWILIDSSLPVGTTKIEGGITYRWNGSGWEVVGDQQDLGVPVGDVSWLLFLLFAFMFVRVRSFFTRVNR